MEENVWQVALVDAGAGGGSGKTTTDCESLTDEKAKLECNLGKLPQTAADEKYAKNIFNEAYAVAGLIAVVVIIVGAVQYVTSGGDPGKVAKAKNTILYSVIGLIIVLLAALITNFVIGQVS